MLFKHHKYKVVNEHGAAYVTYDNFADCQEFLINASKRVPARLRVAENKNPDKKA